MVESKHTSVNPIVPDRNAMIGGSGPGKPHQKHSQMQGKTPSHSTSGRGWSALLLVSFLCVSLGSVFGWQQFSSLQERHNILQQRFEDLESRLTNTDASVSQSGAALQLKLGRQQDELEKHWSEIKKLWGVSNDINKGKIEKNKTDIAFLAKKRVEIGDMALDLKETIATQEKRISAVSGNYLEMSDDLAAIHGNIRLVNDDLLETNATLNRLQRQLKSHDEAIESIDGFRRQVNQKLYKLDQGSNVQ